MYVCMYVYVRAYVCVRVHLCSNVLCVYLYSQARTCLARVCARVRVRLCVLVYK